MADDQALDRVRAALDKPMEVSTGHGIMEAIEVRTGALAGALAALRDELDAIRSEARVLRKETTGQIDELADRIADLQAQNG